MDAVRSWTPTREEGLARLARFVPRAGRDYARLRNYDRGPGRHTDVSTLSPWIRHRLIVEEEVVASVLAQHSLSAADKFVQEVCWRTYWKGWLEMRPSVWTDYRKALARLSTELGRNDGFRDRWARAIDGRTGIDCFDAWAGELVDTGYLHNHARMWFASIWIFTLELPWQLGADFFLRHLLDGDPASNTLSWRWVAGLQTRGKTYLARPGNIARYTEGRFRPGKDLADVARPPEEAPPPDPSPLPDATPRLDARPAGLLLTEEDLHPEFLLDAGAEITHVAAATVAAPRSPLDNSSRVRTFVEGAVLDAAGRLADRPCRHLECPDDDGFAGALLDWTREHGLRQVITAHAPVGPTADRLARASALLASRDVRLVRMMRRWDRTAWPHATHGFFRLRKRIPEILSKTLGSVRSVGGQLTLDV